MGEHVQLISATVRCDHPSDRCFSECAFEFSGSVLRSIGECLVVPSDRRIDDGFEVEMCLEPLETEVENVREHRCVATGWGQDGYPIATRTRWRSTYLAHGDRKPGVRMKTPRYRSDDIATNAYALEIASPPIDLGCRLGGLIGIQSQHLKRCSEGWKDILPSS